MTYYKIVADKYVLQQYRVCCTVAGTLSVSFPVWGRGMSLPQSSQGNSPQASWIS